MAEKNVVRQDVVQITWDVEDSPMKKVTGESDKFKAAVGKAVGKSESKFNKFNQTLQKTRQKFSNATTGAKKLLASVKKVDKEKFNKLTEKVNNLTKAMGSGLVRAAKRAATAIAAIGAGAAVGIFKLTDMASDLSETMNKVDVSFGSNSKAVKDWSKNSITEMGLAQQTALDMAALFGDMGTGMGISQDKAADMSMNLTQLGADLASFKNMEIEEVTTALNGVFTGETESLKRLGVVMTQTNLEAFALSKGLKTPIDEMSESEKVMLRYEYVLSKTKNAQGDFAHTGGGFANQLRMAKEQLKQIGTTVGGIFIGGFEKALKKVNDFGAQLNTKLSEVLADGFQFGDIAKITPMLGPVGTYLQNIANKIRSITSNKEKMAQIKAVFESIKTAAGKVAEFIGKCASKITDFVTSSGFLKTVKGIIDGIASVFGFLANHLQTIINVLVPLAAAFATVVVVIKAISAAITVWNAIQLVLNSGLLACPITWIVLAIAALVAIIVVLVMHWDKVKAAAVNCWNAIKNAFGVAASWVNEKVIQPIANFFKGLWDKITNTVKTVKDAIVGAFSGAFDKVKEIWGKITGFFSGIWDGIKGIVSKILGKGKEATDTAGKVKATKHARGGYFTRPHLGLVAEAGPEFIIPTRDRNRGLALWQQAGRALGAFSAASLSLPHYSPSSSVSTSNTTNHQTNTYSPQFNLSMHGTVDKTTERTVKQWVKEAIEDTLDSMSRTSPRLTEA